RNASAKPSSVAVGIPKKRTLVRTNPSETVKFILTPGILTDPRILKASVATHNSRASFDNPLLTTWRAENKKTIPPQAIISHSRIVPLLYRFIMLRYFYDPVRTFKFSDLPMRSRRIASYQNGVGVQDSIGIENTVAIKNSVCVKHSIGVQHTVGI